MPFDILPTPALADRSLPLVKLRHERRHPLAIAPEHIGGRVDVRVQLVHQQKKIGSKGSSERGAGDGWGGSGTG
jgi:hypothetical protein